MLFKLVLVIRVSASHSRCMHELPKARLCSFSNMFCLDISSNEFILNSILPRDHCVVSLV